MTQLVLRPERYPLYSDAYRRSSAGRIQARPLAFAGLLTVQFDDQQTGRACHLHGKVRGGGASGKLYRAGPSTRTRTAATSAARANQQIRNMTAVQGLTYILTTHPPSRPLPHRWCSPFLRPFAQSRGEAIDRSSSRFLQPQPQPHPCPPRGWLQTAGLFFRRLLNEKPRC